MFDCMAQRVWRVIVVSWHFPPSEEIGGKIVWRLVKHLALLGCDVRVVAPPVTEINHRDDDYANALPPGLRVIRTSIGPNVRNAILDLRNRLLAPRKTQSAAPSSPGDPAPQRKGLRELFGKLLAISDHRDRWIKPASRCIRDTLAAEPADLVLSVSPVFQAHLAVLSARPGLQGIPWLAWFHDPGAHYSVAAGRIAHLSRWERHILRRRAVRERRAIEKMTRLLVTTRRLAEDYIALLPHLRTPLVVPCGFDADEFPRAPQRDDHHKLVIVHVGTIYYGRTPRPIVESLARLKAMGTYKSGEIEMRFVGRLENAEGKQLTTMIEDLDMGDVITFVPQVPQADALRIVGDADVGLVLAENQPTQVPAKIFEYIGLRRPVLALSGGATHDFVRENHIGYACDREGLDDAFSALIADWRLDGLSAFLPALEAAARRYDIAAIAENLVKQIAVEAGH